MSAVEYYEGLLEKALRCGMVYNEPRLMVIFIEGPHPSIHDYMCVYCGANQNGTLHNLEQYTTSLVRLRENTGTTTSSTRDKTDSRLSPSKSSRPPSEIISVMTVKKAEHSSSSPSSGLREGEVIRQSVRKKFKIMPAAVAPIVQQREDPVKTLQENAGYCRPCLRKVHQGKKCPVVSLQVRLPLLQKRESNKGSIFYRRYRSLRRGGPYYHGPAHYAHRSAANVIISNGVRYPSTSYQAGSSATPTQKM